MKIIFIENIQACWVKRTLSQSKQKTFTHKITFLREAASCALNLDILCDWLAVIYWSSDYKTTGRPRISDSIWMWWPSTGLTHPTDFCSWRGKRDICSTVPRRGYFGTGLDGKYLLQPLSDRWWNHFSRFKWPEHQCLGLNVKAQSSTRIADQATNQEYIKRTTGVNDQATNLEYIERHTQKSLT